MSWVIIGTLFAIFAVIRANSIVNRSCEEEKNIPEDIREEISKMTIGERLGILDSLYFKKDQHLTSVLLCGSTVSFTLAGKFYNKNCFWLALLFLLFTIAFALNNYVASKKYEIR